MSRIVFRYLSREIIRSAILVMLVCLALFSFFDFVDQMRRVGINGYAWGHVLAFVALKLPAHIYELMPVALLIGGLYAMINLASQSELTILRVSGLSPLRAFKVLMVIGLFFALITLAIGELVLPYSNRWALIIHSPIKAALTQSRMASGFWARDQQFILNAKNMREGHIIEGVQLFELDPSFRIKMFVQARLGQFDPQQGWIFSDVTRILFAHDKIVPETSPQWIWSSRLQPQLITTSELDPYDMSLRELLPQIVHLQTNRQKSLLYETEFWRRLLYPLACLVMLVFAMPFGHLQQRSGGMVWKMFAGVMLGLGFHMLNQLSVNFGVLNGWPPLVAALLPSTLFLLLALMFLFWVDHR